MRKLNARDENCLCFEIDLFVELVGCEESHSEGGMSEDQISEAKIPFACESLRVLYSPNVRCSRQISKN